jgi:hypothetical protein
MPESVLDIPLIQFVGVVLELLLYGSSIPSVPFRHGC